MPAHFVGVEQADRDVYGYNVEAACAVEEIGQ
jgi:hypothetical protein